MKSKCCMTVSSCVKHCTVLWISYESTESCRNHSLSTHLGARTSTMSCLLLFLYHCAPTERWTAISSCRRYCGYMLSSVMDWVGQDWVGYPSHMSRHGITNPQDGPAWCLFTHSISWSLCITLSIGNGSPAAERIYRATNRDGSGTGPSY